MLSIECSALSQWEAEHTVFRRQSMSSIEVSTCSLYEVEHALNIRQSI